jgi:soluble lytic murein transglycosylase
MSNKYLLRKSLAAWCLSLFACVVWAENKLTVLDTITNSTEKLTIASLSPQLHSSLLLPQTIDPKSISDSILTIVTPAIEQQRKTYASAQKALKRKKLTAYTKHRSQLNDYPLAVYLDYSELKSRLHKLPYADMDSFLLSNQNTLLSKRILKSWLSVLAKKKRWQDFTTYYKPFPESTSLTCFNLESLIKTGDKTAFEKVAPLWNVDHSQPSECDSLFKLWTNSEHFTQDIAWQRYVKTLSAGKSMLAKHIAKSFSSENQGYSKLMQEVHNYPSRLNKQSRFDEQSKKMRQIISHGVKRYAKSDPLTALKRWNRFKKSHTFQDDLRYATQQYIASRLLRKNHYQEAQNLIAGTPTTTTESLLEKIIRGSLKEQDWSRTLTYINKLPDESKNSERWRYWQARSLEQLLLDPIRSSDTGQKTIEDTILIKEIYSELAQERSFYGFMAADILGGQYHLSDNPALPEDSLVKQISNQPAALRAKELLAVNDDINARREWHHMTSTLDQQGHIAAAKLANQWSWHYNTIISLAAAKYWDDLQLRFPLAYNKQVFQTAQEHKISPLLLFAITRQESAFSADARSPAGAMGLMQLMPGTAKMTARKAGIKFTKHDLLQPDKNIALGSHYLTSLLKQFNGNRILAAAAYNAGPYRVKQWLKKSKETLVHDIWIETIPFKETRHYVQNILAYSVIYGYRMGTVPSLLSDKEASQQL